jgi:hypothetical protein
MSKSQYPLNAIALHRPFEAATKEPVALGTDTTEREIGMEFSK